MYEMAYHTYGTANTYLVHPGVGEEEGRVVDGHHRGGRVRRVPPPGLEVVDEGLPNLGWVFPTVRVGIRVRVCGKRLFHTQ